MKKSGKYKINTNSTEKIANTLIIGAIGVGIGIIGCDISDSIIKNLKTTKTDKCNIIFVHDGKIEIIEDTRVKDYSTIDMEYNIVEQNSDFAIIYVYGSDTILEKTNGFLGIDVYKTVIDDDARDIYTDYIISNITINSNNTIFINQENITGNGYKQYKNGIIYKSEEFQRNRKKQ